MKFEDLRVLQTAEELADSVWETVVKWKPFPRSAVGKQLARATDSIGANIAEAYGRYHYGEKLNFLYYARGSLYETKFWLNRAKNRSLIPEQQSEVFSDILNSLGKQINAFIASIRKNKSDPPKQLKEQIRDYDPGGTITELTPPEDDATTTNN
jgi:four helix bundle protein